MMTSVHTENGFRINHRFTNHLIKIATFFLQMAPVDLVVAEIECLDDWPLSGAQDDLYAVLSKVYDFPLSVKYVTYFNKAIARLVENSGQYWNDNLAELILGYGNCGNLHACDDACYSGFLLDDAASGTSTVVSCCVDRAHNLVGLKIWGAGVLWAEIL